MFVAEGAVAAPGEPLKIRAVTNRYWPVLPVADRLRCLPAAEEPFKILAVISRY